MKILIKTIKGIFWVISAWQIFTLLPALTWVSNLSGVTGEMWARFGIKITLLIICYMLYRFFDKKYKAISTIKASKEISGIATSIAKIPKEYAIIGVSSVAVFLVVFIIINSFGASTYEDCILEKLEGVGSDKAASYIRQACRKKFPIQATPLLDKLERDLQAVDKNNPYDLGPAKKKYSSDEIDRFLEDVKYVASNSSKAKEIQPLDKRYWFSKDAKELPLLLNINTTEQNGHCFAGTKFKQYSKNAMLMTCFNENNITKDLLLMTRDKHYISAGKCQNQEYKIHTVESCKHGVFKSYREGRIYFTDTPLQDELANYNMIIGTRLPKYWRSQKDINTPISIEECEKIFTNIKEVSLGGSCFTYKN